MHTPRVMICEDERTILIVAQIETLSFFVLETTWFLLNQDVDFCEKAEKHRNFILTSDLR